MLLYAIIASAVVVVGYILLFERQLLPFWKRDKDKGDEEAGEKKGENKRQLPELVLCRVADNITSRIYNATITRAQAEAILDEHGTLGRQWDRYGKKVYGLVKDMDGEKEILKPIMVEQAIKSSPAALYGDTRQHELEIIYKELLRGDEDTRSFGEKYGQIIWWVAVMAFIGLLYASS